MKITRCVEFEKEFGKLCKKYRSLEEDFTTFLLTLELDPFWENILSNHIVQISWLWADIKHSFYKVRKFTCRSISWNSSNSGLRIVYRYIDETWEIEFSEIEFVEIFHKNQKENHDIERIRKYYKKDK